MANWQYDSRKQDLGTVFFDYEVESLRYLWNRKGEYASSREVWTHVTKIITISRTSIINSLNRMVKSGVLVYKEKTGKGGHQGLYSITMSETELKKHIAEELNESIRKNLG